MTDTAPIPYAPDTEAWQRTRRMTMGASEVAAVLGLNPWRSPLDVWAEKTGLVPSNSTATLATRLGHELEDLIARLWAEQHPDDTVTHTALTLRHPNIPWLVASADREVNDDGLLECKLVGARAGSDWDDGVPDYVAVQCLTQMAVTGRSWVDVCSLHTGFGWEHRVHRINRDDDWIARMLEQVERFWSEHIIGGRRPELVGDPKRVRQTLAKLHPGDVDAPPAILDRSVQEDIDTLKRAKNLLKDLQADITRIENDLIGLIGDATEAFVDTDQKPIYTYRTQSRTGHDLNALKAGIVPGFTPDEVATARRVLDALTTNTTFRVLRIR